MNASDCPLLPPGVVHIYWVPLVATAGTEHSLPLPPEETARAEQLRFQEHRARWLLSRIALRRILALYTDTSAEKLSFLYSAYGKPSLAAGGPYFNLSHSEDAALVAVHGQCEVGIDIEYRREFPDLADMARTVFSVYEQREWSAVQGPDRIAAFFRIWTRKEAYIKGRGLGLAIPLDTFDVSLAPDEGPHLQAVRDKETEAGPWQVWDVSVPVPYAAAVAVQGPAPERIERFQWRWPS